MLKNWVSLSFDWYKGHKDDLFTNIDFKELNTTSTSRYNIIWWLLQQNGNLVKNFCALKRSAVESSDI